MAAPRHRDDVHPGRRATGHLVDRAGDVVMYARPSVRNLPPVRHQHGTIARCMGGCGTALEDRKILCDVCWVHLPRSLRRAVLAWRRTADPNVRTTIVLDVEAACALARRRAR